MMNDALRRPCTECSKEESELLVYHYYVETLCSWMESLGLEETTHASCGEIYVDQQATSRLQGASDYFPRGHQG